jgi:thioredoxin 1
MANVKEVTDATFQSEVLSSSTPVLVDFWATWCGPCRMVAPVVEQLAGEYAGKLDVRKMDVDQNQDTAMQYGIMSIPTLIVFKNGKPVQKVVGYMPKDKMKQAIDPVL